MGKLPAFLFYPRDWLTDANLRRCSPGARSLWIDLLCIMWETDIRGVLSTDGEPWSDDEIAKSVPGDTYQNLLGLQELLRNRVAKRNDIGAVYSKRFIDDERLRGQWRDRQGRHRGDVTHDVTLKSRRSSSSSSVSSTSPPTPSNIEGEESYFEWCRETIGVRMGRHRRLPNLSALQGLQAKYLAEELTKRGFPARVVEDVAK